MKDLLELARWAREKFGWWIVIISPVLALVAAMAAFLDQVTAGVLVLNEHLEGLLPYINTGISTLAPYFVKANTFFPVSECFQMIGWLFALRIAAAMIRMTKSFIPGIS